MARQIFGTIFMGAGERTAKDIQALHEILDEALSTLSGLQQGGEDQDGQFEREMENAVRDIGAAILGKEIRIGEKLPYPPQKPLQYNP